MTKREIPMDTGLVLDLFRERISDMSGCDIEFIFNTHFANAGEKLVFQSQENFIFEVPKND